MMQRYKVGRIDELPDGKGIAIEARGRTIAVFRFGQEVRAIHNSCPHKGASLCDGRVDAARQIVRCPWHQWSWRLDDGTFEVDPRVTIRTYKVVVEDGEVILEA
jgi:NAD(P)H-dependent nitrite reductase small subunit